MREKYFLSVFGLIIWHGVCHGLLYSMSVRLFFVILAWIAQAIISLYTYCGFIPLTRIVQDDIFFSLYRICFRHHGVFNWNILWCARCRELHRKYFPFLLVVVYSLVTGCAELMFCFYFGMGCVTGLSWHGLWGIIFLVSSCRELVTQLSIFLLALFFFDLTIS